MPATDRELLDGYAKAMADRIGQHLASRFDDRPLLSPKDVALRLGISERTTRDILARGDITSFKVAGSRKIHPRDLDAYIIRAHRAAKD